MSDQIEATDQTQLVSVEPQLPLDTTTELQSAQDITDEPQVVTTEPQPVEATATQPQEPQGYPQPMPPQGYGPPQAFPVPPGAPQQPQGYPQPMSPQGYGPPQGFPVPPGAPQQPQAEVVWMPPPQAIANCPPGLEYLTQIDQILVHQQVELWEVVTGYQTANRYVVKNTLGQQVYFAAENSSPFWRQCCSINRPFELSILDNAKNEVIHMERPFSCSTNICCIWCPQKLEVQAPPGQIVGYVRQNVSCWNPSFSIQDAEEREVLHMTGSMAAICCRGCYGDIDFELTTLEDVSVGKVSKQWGGLAKEYFTSADNFGIKFPMDLDVKMKAVVMGACFLIDFIFFEQAQQQQGRRGHQHHHLGGQHQHHQHHRGHHHHHHHH